MIKAYYDIYERVEDGCKEDGYLVVARRIWRYCVTDQQLYATLRSRLGPRQFRTLAGFITKWSPIR